MYFVFWIHCFNLFLSFSFQSDIDEFSSDEDEISDGYQSNEVSNIFVSAWAYVLC